MTDKTCNGWTNYETWNVALWLGNEEGTQRYWSDRAQEEWDGASGDEDRRYDASINALSDALEDEFSDGADALLEGAKQTASVWADLLAAALSEVNWREIAEHFLEDVDKAAESEPCS